MSACSGADQLEIESPLDQPDQSNHERDQRTADEHIAQLPAFLQPGPPSLARCSSTWNKAASRAAFSAALAATSRTPQNAPRRSQRIWRKACIAEAPSQLNAKWESPSASRASFRPSETNRARKLVSAAALNAKKSGISLH